LKWKPSLKETSKEEGTLQWGKLVGDQTLKCSGQARSKERASLFLMFKQNLNPFY
jgi:hypothetical protein